MPNVLSPPKTHRAAGILSVSWDLGTFKLLPALGAIVFHVERVVGLFGDLTDLNKGHRAAAWWDGDGVMPEMLHSPFQLHISSGFA